MTESGNFSIQSRIHSSLQLHINTFATQLVDKIAILKQFVKL